MKNVYKFLKELRKNNNREWFNENKEWYLEVKNEIEIFTSQLIGRIAEFDPEAATLTPAQCTYRIYRDTRFSHDKTPYKTHIGVVVCPGGTKKSYRCCYYVHFEPGNSFIGGGCWCPPAPLLKEIRKSIFDNIDEYLEIVKAPQFQELYGFPGHDLLKTAPKDFPKDWPYLEYIKPREYTVHHAASDRDFCRPDLIETVGKDFEILKPFNDFINYIFEEKTQLAFDQRGRQTHKA